MFIRPFTSTLADLDLQRDSKIPLQKQLFSQLRKSILEGQLAIGTRLPSSRQLAGELKISRNTAVSAYEQLIAEGYLDATTGSGTRVAELPPEHLLQIHGNSKPRTRAPKQRLHLSKRGEKMVSAGREGTDANIKAFQPGLPALDLFPFPIWSRLVGRILRHPSPDTLGYQEVGGYHRLRENLAEYLRASRSVRCDPDQIIVVTGAQAALDLCCRLLVDPGDNAWLEEPGYLGARGALINAGADLNPIPVDASGMDIETGIKRCPKPQIICVTPSYQFPLGVTMSLERRLALLDYAKQINSWIIEDDYDSEYRYRGRPLSSLQGLDTTGKVIYMGTFSKTMFPSLRVAYVVVPKTLAQAFRKALKHTGQDAPLHIQAALAEFLQQGYFSSHLRKMRQVYAQRQACFVEACERHLKGLLTVQATDAGMQLIGKLPPQIDIKKTLSLAREQGLSLSNLADYYYGKPEIRGLFLGYAAVTEKNIETHVKELGEILKIARQ